MRREVLIVVDVQHDFLPGGALAVPDGNAVIGPICTLMGDHGRNTMFFTQDFHPKGHVSFASSHPGCRVLDRVPLSPDRVQTLWPDHCVQGSHGAEICKDVLYPALVANLVMKGTHRDYDSYSGFKDDGGAETRLPAMIRNLHVPPGALVINICGLATDYCVFATAIDALEYGRVRVHLDACRGVAPDTTLTAIRAMLSAGVEVIG